MTDRKSYVLLKVTPFTNEIIGIFNSLESLSKAVDIFLDRYKSSVLVYEQWRDNNIDCKECWDYCYIPIGYDISHLSGDVPENHMFGKNLLAKQRFVATVIWCVPIQVDINGYEAVNIVSDLAKQVQDDYFRKTGLVFTVTLNGMTYIVDNLNKTVKPQ
jgi:hypothetical protein